MAITQQRRHVQSRRYAPTAVVSLVATLLLGAAHLHFPFTGDQALFSVFGRMIDDGAVLYQDVWDIKQPGIFGFYWLAGRLFGFTEIGAHLLELLYLLGFSAVLMRLLRHRYQHQWVGALLPLATAGWYYAVAPANYLTQVEALVGPLLFGTGWLTWKGGTNSWFGAGLLGGLVLFLKLAYLPIVVAIWLIALLELLRGDSRHHDSASIRDLVRKAIPALGAGMAVVAAPSLAYVIANGLAERLWWTFVSYPPQVLPIAGRTMQRLTSESGEYVLRFLPLILLAAWGTWARIRDPLTRIMAVWVAGGLATYFLQLWWGYLLLTVMVPVALMALDGLDDMLSHPRRLRQAAVVLGITALPALAVLGGKSLDLVKHELGLGGSRIVYQSTVSQDYETVRADLNDVAQLAPDKPVYILGNPLYLYLAGRDQVPAVTGWSPELWTDRVWDEVGHGLQDQRPPLLLIDEFSASLMRARSPETLVLIEEHYETLRPSSRDGLWYQVLPNGQG